MSHSSITREASFTVDRNQHRDPQLYNVHRVRDFAIFSHKWDYFTISLSSLSGNYVEEEKAKLQESEGIDDSKEMVSFRYYRIYGHRN